jgi:hypothetical protein
MVWFLLIFSSAATAETLSAPGVNVRVDVAQAGIQGGYRSKSRWECAGGQAARLSTASAQ